MPYISEADVSMCRYISCVFFPHSHCQFPNLPLHVFFLFGIGVFVKYESLFLSSTSEGILDFLLSILPIFNSYFFIPGWWERKNCFRLNVSQEQDAHEIKTLPSRSSLCGNVNEVQFSLASSILFFAGTDGMRRAWKRRKKSFIWSFLKRKLAGVLLCFQGESAGLLCSVLWI